MPSCGAVHCRMLASRALIRPLRQRRQAFWPSSLPTTWQSTIVSSDQPIKTSPFWPLIACAMPVSRSVAVIASSEREAAAAVALLEVDLEELPAVTTLDEALAPDAPLLHETFALAGHFRDLANLRPIPGSNICHHFHFARGDIAQGFAEAEAIFEDTFTFPMVHHYSMEPHVAIAQVGHDQITVWASTQHPFPVRKELAEMFGLPLSHVQVIVPYLGGAYGNKSYTKIEPLVVAMAQKVGSSGASGPHGRGEF